MSLAEGFDLLVEGAPIALLGVTIILGIGVLAGHFRRGGPALRQK